jgi:hypothetical protein
MDIKIITVKGHLLNGNLYCNIGTFKPRNYDKFQNNIKGFFKIHSDGSYIVEYLWCNQTLKFA